MGIKFGENFSKSFSTIVARSWRIILGILAPILLSPLLFDNENKVNQCAFVLLLMVIFWVFEPISIYITALIPVALFPILNITTTEEVCQNYMKAANMMFLGGLIIGISLEHSNLHQRIALKVIMLFGSSIKLLMAGVMIVTMFLSMWINNTATTAMMIPIIDGILQEIKISNLNNNDKTEEEDCDDQNQNCTVTVSQEQTLNQSKQDDESDSFKMKEIRKAFLLSIAYSANIGGTATLTGTGTNLVFQDAFFSQFENSTDISFTSWFFYACPSALLTVLVAWLLLYVFFARIPYESSETGQIIKHAALKKYQKLGPMTFHEKGVFIHFIAIVLLWFLRQPEIFPGWASLLTDKPHDIKDATPVILVVVSMFLFPANLKQFYSNEQKLKKIERLLDWKIVKQKMSWGVFILLGGGFALAFGTEKSKLSDWFSKQLGNFDLPPFVTMLVLVLLSASITEIASNVATASVVLPVIGRLAVHMGVNPLVFMIPVTISISFAFMFPVSTPPNAIVFEYLDISVFEMVKPGIFMNISAIGIQLIFINTVGRWMFDLDKFPDWAQASTNITNTTDTTLAVI